MGLVMMLAGVSSCQSPSPVLGALEGLGGERSLPVVSLSPHLLGDHSVHLAFPSPCFIDILTWMVAPNTLTATDG